MEAVKTTINKGINRGTANKGSKTEALLVTDAIAPVKVKIPAKPNEHNVVKVNRENKGMGENPYNKIKKDAPARLIMSM